MIPATWAFTRDKGVEISDLVKELIESRKIEGVTILGGEPFDQSEALLQLVSEIKQRSDLSIMLFTGYRSKFLEEHNTHYNKIIAQVDIFIEGPYIKEETDFSREWVGSSNQEIHFISDRYKYLKDSIIKDSEKNKIEVRLSKDGSFSINGILPKEQLEALVCDLKSKYHE